MAAYPAVAAWLERVATTPGAIDDLEPYPAAAHAARVGAPRTTPLESEYRGWRVRG